MLFWGHGGFLSFCGILNKFWYFLGIIDWFWECTTRFIVSLKLWVFLAKLGYTLKNEYTNKKMFSIKNKTTLGNRNEVISLECKSHKFLLNACSAEL